MSMAVNITHLHQGPHTTSSCCGGAQTTDRTNSTRRNTPKTYDYLFKLLLIGDPGVGKTTLLLHFTEGIFIGGFVSTIGIDFKIKTVELDGKKVKLQIWDTAGGERYGFGPPSKYRGAQGVMVLYDVTKQVSFDNVEGWLDDIKQHASEDVSIILVGNKCDLTTDKVVEYTTAKEFAEQHGLLFIETSSKDGTNVEEVFITLAAVVQSRVLSQGP